MRPAAGDRERDAQAASAASIPAASVHDFADRRLFLHYLAAVRKKRFVVYAKPPFSGPKAVLTYLSRYTHRVAIADQRLIAFDRTGVTLCRQLLRPAPATLAHCENPKSP